jgi:hypothetical protein
MRFRPQGFAGKFLSLNSEKPDWQIPVKFELTIIIELRLYMFNNFPKIRPHKHKEARCE